MDHDQGASHEFSEGQTETRDGDGNGSATDLPHQHTDTNPPSMGPFAPRDFAHKPNLYFLRLLEATPDGILICDADLTVLSANRRAANQFQVSPFEFPGLPLNQLIPGLATDLKGTEGVVPLGASLKANRKDGTTFPVEVYGHVDPMSLDGAYILFVHDITARVKVQKRQNQIQEQIDETRRLESIGSLSAGIAHEINTPIQFVGDNLDYMSEALEPIFDACRKCYQTQPVHGAKGTIEGDIQEVSDALSESREGIKQVRDIVLLMKQFAHPGTGGMSRADLNEIVQNVASVCRNRWKHVGRLDLKLAEILPKLHCRIGQIQQVILNLTINAIDAIEADGLLERRVCIETDYDDDHVIISISDTGSGIPAEIRKRIFDPFFTTKPVGKGTGQGLALAKDVIIKGHGGQLQLAEKEGFATTFQILLMKNEIVASTEEEF